MPLPAIGPFKFGRSFVFAITGLLLLLGAVAGAANYPGRTVSWLVFSAASFCAVVPAVVFRPSFYLLFTSTFLFLGFWAKCAVHFLLNVAFIEPIGHFDSGAAEWDRALEFASCGLGGVAAATLIAIIFFPSRWPGVPALPRLPATASLVRYLFWTSLVILIVMFAVNYHYAIIRIGFVPKLNVHPYAYVVFSFIVSWGGILWLLSLTLWLTWMEQWKPTALFYVSAVEGSLACLSMGSRSQMLLHVLPAIGTYLIYARSASSRRLTGGDKVKVALVLAAMFGCSLSMVSLDRAVQFSGATPLETAGRLLGAQGCEQADKGCQIASRSEPAPDKRIEDKKQIEDKKRIADRSISFSISLIPRELSRLVLIRWIGIEGVLVTSSESDTLGFQLLRDGLFEFPSAGANAMYQRMSGSYYQRFSNFVFMTIPGPVAIASYSGSPSFTFLAMFAAATLFHVIEYFALFATGNIAAAAVTGVALAYTTIQMNFPRTAFFFALELFGAIIVIAIFSQLFRRPRSELSVLAPFK